MVAVDSGIKLGTIEIHVGDCGGGAVVDRSHEEVRYRMR